MVEKKDGSTRVCVDFRPSTLPYASPIIMVKKKDGSNRVCVDFRPSTLNYASPSIMVKKKEGSTRVCVDFRPSTLPYASPIVMVKKKGGSNRVCVDFRKLNKITEVDPEPMTMTETLFRQISGKKYLSKIDMTKGYWQIPIAPENVYKTAFVTPDGKYEFLQMPFGMVNSGATLVRRLKKVLEGVSGVW